MNKLITNNYCRNIVTGEYLFFSTEMPALTNPEFWAFYKLPKGQDADLFRGRLVGENPASNPESSASAA
jgi:hypothetical protein